MDSEKDKQLRSAGKSLVKTQTSGFPLRPPLMERKMTLHFGFNPDTGTGTLLHTDEDTGLVSQVAQSQGKPGGGQKPAIDKGVVIDHDGPEVQFDE